MGNKSSNVSQDGDSPKKKTKNEAELATKNEAGHATRSKVESEALTEKRKLYCLLFSDLFCNCYIITCPAKHHLFKVVVTWKNTLIYKWFE